MKKIHHLLPLAACLFSAAAWSASEAGSSASSATSAASNSIGASSASLTTSSNSSSKDNKVAAGDYTIIELVQADEAGAGPAAKARLTLRAVRGEDGARAEFVLLLPPQTVAQARLARGDTITVRQRPYGLELAGGPARQAFFLVLDDAWHRELASTAVVL
jgi:hypothetical protein